MIIDFAKIDVEHVREFVTEYLSLNLVYYEAEYKANKKGFNKFTWFTRINSGFFSRLAYALSAGIKMSLSGQGKGHYVSHESYEEFRKRRRFMAKSDADSLKERGNSDYQKVQTFVVKMQNSIKSTYDLISKDDTALLKFYRAFLENAELQNTNYILYKCMSGSGAKIEIRGYDFRFGPNHRTVDRAKFRGPKYVREIRVLMHHELSYQKKYQASIRDGSIQEPAISGTEE